MTPFPPMSREEMDRLGWDSCDIALVPWDAYVDHPSFGMALIGRTLQAPRAFASASSPSIHFHMLFLDRVYVDHPDLVGTCYGSMRRANQHILNGREFTARCEAYIFISSRFQSQKRRPSQAASSVH